MYAASFETKFLMDDFIMHEAPITWGLFQSNHTVRSDLEGLFSFATNNKDAMPFYVFSREEASEVAVVSERVYDALCSAVDYLAVNPQHIEKYFGKDFCQAYPEFIEYALWTYDQNHEGLYGRFDMAMDPTSGKISGVYEFNGNTPVMLFESTILQNWLVDRVNECGDIQFDQNNEYFPETVVSLPRALLRGSEGKATAGILLHSQYIEDSATCETLYQAFDSIPWCETYIDHLDNVEFGDVYSAESPFIVNGVPMKNIFALQPWEEIVASCYDDVICHWREWADKVRFFEPAWRWFVSNKGIWALMTHLLETDKDYAAKYGDLPILRTYMSPERFIESGKGYVKKPLIGRLSNNIQIFNSEGTIDFESDGVYGEEECVYQEYCPPGRVEGRNNFIVGQWMAGMSSASEPLMMQAASLCIREFDKPVLDIKNERFIPHLIQQQPG